MIVIYDGTPGSGKTYEAMLVVIENLKKRRVIYTNIDGLTAEKQRVVLAGKGGLTIDELGQFLHVMTDSQVREFWNHAPPGSLVIVDETQKYFNAKDWKDSSNRALSDWADEHRHNGYDVIFLTPRMAKIDSGVRALAEWVYTFRKMNMFGGAVQQKYRLRIYYGDAAEGQYLSQTIKTYDKTVFACYSSYFADGTKEKNFVKGVNILKHPAVLAIPVAIGVFLFFFARSPMAHGDFLGVKGMQEQTAKRGEVPPPGNAPSEQPGGSSPLAADSDQSSWPYPAADGERWHSVVGWVNREGGSALVLLENGDRITRYVKLDRDRRCVLVRGG